MCAEQEKKNKMDQLIEPKELIKELETRLREIKSEIIPEIQPLRHFMEIKQEGGKPSSYFITMPAYIPSIKCFGVKLLTLFPDNIDTGHPVHRSIVRLYESQHGQLLAELDGDPITSERTAAVSAIAAGVLCPKAGGPVLAVIGSGIQARSHIRYFTCIRDFKEIRVWSRKTENIKSCIESVQQAHNIRTPLIPSNSAEEACTNADVIITVTLSQAPVVRGSWLKEGALVVSVGACRPNWRELDDDVMRNAAIYVDNEVAARAESGDIVMSGTGGEILGDIGWLLREGAGMGSFRGGKKFVVFKSLGMAIEDVIAAHLIYSKKNPPKSEN